MPAVISGLFASRLQRDELVAKIDEGHRLALAAQLKSEDAAIECQRFLDIADFQRYMVETDGARLCGADHLNLLLQSLTYQETASCRCVGSMQRTPYAPWRSVFQSCAFAQDSKS